MEIKDVLSWLNIGGAAISIQPLCCCCMNMFLHFHSALSSLQRLLIDSFCILFIQVMLKKIIKEKLDLQRNDHIPGSYCQSDFLFYLILYDEWF